MIQWFPQRVKLANVVRKIHMERTKHLVRNPQISKGIVEHISDLSPTIKLLKVRIENKKFDFKPGQWVDFHIPGVDVVGGYSICSSPQLLKQDRMLHLAVKYSAHAPAHWVHTKCKFGDEVSLAVGGDLSYTRNCHNSRDNILLIAGGVGINPLFSIFNYIHLNKSVYNEAFISKTHLLYSVVSEDELIFKDEMDAIASRDASMKVSYFVSKHVSDKKKEKIQYRRINENDVRIAISDMPCNRSDVISYLCGPQVMMNSMKNVLTLLGLQNENIRYESWW